MVNKGIFITGTDTGVGKTQVASGLALAVQRRLESSNPILHNGVQLWKPVQTGVRLGDPAADSYRLWRGSGCHQAEEEIATITLPDAVAPWMAAQRAGTEIDYEALVDEGRSRINQAGYLIIEGAGGLAVPLTGNTLIGHLALQLDLPVVLIARTGLGTVNHTLLSLSFAKMLGVRVAGVILNGYQDSTDLSLHENVMMIEQFGGVPVLGKLPWFPCGVKEPAEWLEWRRQWVNLIEEHIDLGKLITT
ncbi:MAG TPA: dethiobiotin synthase [Bacilli bacterium]